MNLDLDRKYVFKDGIYDYLGSTDTLVVNNEQVKIELDYAWDYESDPVITPTIIHEWKYLDDLVSRKVFPDAKSVLSIGGGGTSRTHEYLSPLTQEFSILNTGIWDLENAQLPKKHVTIFKILATAEDMPILSSQIDAIEIPATLDHVIDANKVIEECFRVLVAGGKIGITLGNSASWYRELIKFLRIGVADNHEHHHNFHFTVRDVENLLSKAGFVEIETRGSAYLKLPKRVERMFKLPASLFIHRFISDSLLRLVFGNSRGGMFLTYALKPRRNP